MKLFSVLVKPFGYKKGNPVVKIKGIEANSEEDALKRAKSHPDFPVGGRAYMATQYGHKPDRISWEERSHE